MKCEEGICSDKADLVSTLFSENKNQAYLLIYCSGMEMEVQKQATIKFRHRINTKLPFL